MKKARRRRELIETLSAPFDNTPYTHTGRLTTIRAELAQVYMIRVKEALAGAHLVAEDQQQRQLTTKDGEQQTSFEDELWSIHAHKDIAHEKERKRELQKKENRTDSLIYINKL